MNRSSIALPLLLALGACGGGGGGGGESQDGSGEHLLPTTQIEVVLQMDEPPAHLQRSLAGFAEENAIQLSVAKGVQERPALVELDAAEFAEWLHAGRLSPLPESLAGLTADVWAAEAGAWEGEAYGLPWRVLPTGLLLSGAVDGLRDWPELAIFQQQNGSWGSDPAALLPTFLSLVASGSANFGASSTPLVDTDAWAEALGFLTRSLPLDQLCASEELERRFVAGSVAIIPADPSRWRRLRALQPQRPLSLLPFPPLDAEAGVGRASLEIRFLVFPRSGAYPDLAAALARELHRRSGELLAGIDGGFVPANKNASIEWEDWSRWKALLADGRALAPFPHRASWEAAVGHAIRQSIDRKRNPEQALADAQTQIVQAQGL